MTAQTPLRLFETICRTCDGQRRIVGHWPDCDDPDCHCLEMQGWKVRCPECSPDLVPELVWDPETALVPY